MGGTWQWLSGWPERLDQIASGREHKNSREEEGRHSMEHDSPGPKGEQLPPFGGCCEAGVIHACQLMTNTALPAFGEAFRGTKIIILEQSDSNTFFTIRFIGYIHNVPNCIHSLLFKIIANSSSCTCFDQYTLIN